MGYEGTVDQGGGWKVREGHGDISNPKHADTGRSAITAGKAPLAATVKKIILFCKVQAKLNSS